MVNFGHYTTKNKMGSNKPSSKGNTRSEEQLKKWDLFNLEKTWLNFICLDLVIFHYMKKCYKTGSTCSFKKPDLVKDKDFQYRNYRNGTEACF